MDGSAAANQGTDIIMASTVLTDAACQEVLDAVERNGGSLRAAARELGIARSTMRTRMTTATSRQLAPEVQYPTFPADDIPVEEIIELSKRRFTKRHDLAKAKRWFPVKINMDGAIGLSFFGDPHVDDDGCNWPELHHHCELHAKTEGLYGLNIGDTTNNWIGRLVRLYAEQETSKHTGRKLAEWFLKDSGVTWACWLMGNHDMWNEGEAILRAMNATAVPMEDWQARFRLVLPKAEVKIWASHQFAGNSMWNTLHGMQKAAHMKEEAHIYAAGHTHNWACHQEESASRNFVYWLIRSRGYKFMDDHSEKMGHDPQQEGAAITTIINPDARTKAGFVTAFADMDLAVDYLNFLRRK
jgi:transposase-like protein